MSEKSPFAKFHHIGILVKDMDKAIAYFESLGLGPFEPLVLSGDELEQSAYGKPTKRKLKNMCTHVGVVELEVIQPLEDAVLQENFMKTRGEGINHIGFKVEDVDSARAELEKKGLKVIQTRSNTSGMKSIYVDSDKVGGVQIEIWQPPAK
ncbi:VOC family protein [Chloroflexota bacterium]